MEIPLGIYRHYKGQEYEVIGIGRHTESSEELVFYRALYDNRLWARPVDMFTSLVEGTGMYRFKFVREK